MPEALDYLWPVLEAIEPVVSASTLSRWPKKSRESLIASGLLKGAGTAKFVRCPACDRGHVERVVSRETATGDTRLFIPCPEVLRAEVFADELRQYCIDLRSLVQSIASSLSLSGTIRSVDSDRLWSCGQLKWHGGIRDVLFGRGLPRKASEGVQPTGTRATYLHPILLVPLEPPPTNTWQHPPTVIPLVHVASLRHTTMHVDGAKLTAMICQAEETDVFALFVFRRYGRFWRLTFEGETIYQLDSAGLSYIARLLAEPNRDIAAVTLQSLRTGLDQQLSKGSSDELLDLQGQQNLSKRFEEAKEEIEEARRMNDTANLEKLQNEMNAILEDRTRATGLGGRLRKRTDVDRVRNAVSMAVTREIVKIAEEHKPLGRHLEVSISSGIEFRYTPEKPIDWLT